MTVHPAVVIVLAVLTAALKAWGLWLTDRRVRHDREGRG